MSTVTANLDLFPLQSHLTLRCTNNSGAVTLLMSLELCSQTRISVSTKKPKPYLVLKLETLHVVHVSIAVEQISL